MHVKRQYICVCKSSLHSTTMQQHHAVSLHQTHKHTNTQQGLMLKVSECTLHCTHVLHSRSVTHPQSKSWKFRCSQNAVLHPRLSAAWVWQITWDYLSVFFHSLLVLKQHRVFVLWKTRLPRTFRENWRPDQPGTSLKFMFPCAKWGVIHT